MNKRKEARLACLVPVDGKVGGQSCTVDISKRGLGFISKQRIPLHKKIAIELDLTSEADPVLVIGQVKWVRQVPASKNYRIGVFFKDVLNDSKSRLYKYFRK